MENNTEDISSAPVKKLSPEAVSNSLRQVESIIKQESMEITNSTDNIRAQEYLVTENLESTISPLMQAAEQHIAQGKLSLPSDDSAWNDYQQVLAIDATNSKAKAGLSKIRNHLIDNADTAIEIGEFDNTESWLVQLDEIQPDDSLQFDLRADIQTQIKLEAEEQLRNQKERGRLLKLENILAQAQKEEKSIPINYIKINELYNRALELDQKNKQAVTGLKKLLEDLLDRADLALREDDVDLSHQLLVEAGIIDADNKRLSSLQLALDSRVAQQLQELPLINTEDNSMADAPSNQPVNSSVEASIEPPVEPAIALSVNKNPVLSVVADVTADEVTQRRNRQQLEDGIRAYYDGNYNKSFELLHPLAEEGFARAQFRIGVMYRYGRSVTTNADLSEKWFTQALPSILRFAQQGVAWAQTDLGTAYELGISLKQDFERAAYWYRLAADQEYPGAQTNLGVLYANGEGVTYNRSQAVYWLKKAARQGDLVALENLRVLGETL